MPGTVGRLPQARQQRGIRPFRVEADGSVRGPGDDRHAGSLRRELERVEELVDDVVALDLERRRRKEEEKGEGEVAIFEVEKFFQGKKRFKKLQILLTRRVMCVLDLPTNSNPSLRAALASATSSGEGPW